MSQHASVEPGREKLTGENRSEPVYQSLGLQGGSDVEVDITSDDDGSMSESSKGQILDIQLLNCGISVSN